MLVSPMVQRLALATLAAATTAAILTVIQPAWAQQYAGGVQVFPASNVWNTKIDNLPVDKNSSRYVNSIGFNTRFHPDWGSNPEYGIPFNFVSGPLAPAQSITFEYDDESDPGPYPQVSTALKVEALDWNINNNDGDRHVLMINTSTNTLYELYHAYYDGSGHLQAGSGAIFPLYSNALRPDGWTSTDAAGLPVFPALVNYTEASTGPIRHAFRFTGSRSNGYVWPARHKAGAQTAGWPPLGQRFRLKKSFNISAFTTDPTNRRILTAMKEYGMFYADHGSNWYMSGAPDPNWDDDKLNDLKRLKGSDFEAVDESSLMITPDSAAAGPLKPAVRNLPTTSKPWPIFR